MTTPNLSSTPKPTSASTSTVQPLSTTPFTLLPSIHALLTRLLPADASVPNASTQPPLSPKSVPLETAKIRHKIQAARQLVDGLPDIERTVEEQEQEIRQLEEVIQRRREVLARLGSIAGMELKEGIEAEKEGGERDVEMGEGE